MATKSSTSISDTAPICIRGRTGLKPDSPDHRDFRRVYGSPDIPSIDDHPVVDLRRYVNQVFDQGKLNSCAANAVCAAYELQIKRQAEVDGNTNYFDASRLFLYYNARLKEGTTAVDIGISLRNTLKSIIIGGVCEESLWPYDVMKYADKPPARCFIHALRNKIYRYESLRQEIDQLRACLKEGFPFAFGFKVYSNFCVSNDGLMPLPSDQDILATPDPDIHAVLAVGYNDYTKCVTVLNSWGTLFGDNGYFYMPYKHITNPEQALYFWKIEKYKKLRP